MKLSRRVVVAGSVVAIGLAVGGQYVYDQHQHKPSLEYSDDEYRNFGTSMKTGKLGVKAYQRALSAAAERVEYEPHLYEKIAALKIGKRSSIILGVGNADIDFTPGATGNTGSLTIARSAGLVDGENYYDRSMTVSFENPSRDFFGAEAEPSEITEFFEDPDTRVTSARYKYVFINGFGERVVPCEWQASFSATSAEVETKSTDCQPALTDLPSLASYADAVVPRPFG